MHLRVVIDFLIWLSAFLAVLCIGGSLALNGKSVIPAAAEDHYGLLMLRVSPMDGWFYQGTTGWHFWNNEQRNPITIQHQS